MPRVFSNLLHYYTTKCFDFYLSFYLVIRDKKLQMLTSCAYLLFRNH